MESPPSPSRPSPATIEAVRLSGTGRTCVFIVAQATDKFNHEFSQCPQSGNHRMFLRHSLGGRPDGACRSGISAESLDMARLFSPDYWQYCVRISGDHQPSRSWFPQRLSVSSVVPSPCFHQAGKAPGGGWPWQNNGKIYRTYIRRRPVSAPGLPDLLASPGRVGVP